MEDFQFNYYQYKKRINNNLKFNFSVVFILIILLLGMAIYLKPGEKKLNFYLVEIASFQTYSKASTFANEIRQQHGAGYIYYDYNYKVLATYFTSKSDAEKVISNLDITYPNAKVYTLQVSKNFKLNLLNKKQSDAVEKLNKNLQETINLLSNASVLLDKQELSLNKFNLQTNEIINSFSDLYENFLNLFKQNSTHNVTKEHLKNIQTNLTCLTNVKDEQYLHNNLKFKLIDIVINYANFLLIYLIF
jgi:ABC-type multidrug transport system fused ATPase/permease subunit